MRLRAGNWTSTATGPDAFAGNFPPFTLCRAALCCRLTFCLFHGKTLYAVRPNPLRQRSRRDILASAVGGAYSHDMEAITLPEAGDILPHVKWFAAYAGRQYDRCEGDDGPMRLKEKHTLAVLGHAGSIVRKEKFSPRISRACLLAALYHDVARFEQYLRHGTFRDGESRNHGLWGACILKREGCLAHEAVPVRRLVLAAVALHNRYALPAALPADAACVTEVVRDADKLDILRVMDEHLSGPRPYCPTVVLNLPDAADKVSEKVLEDALRGRVAAYADLRSVNDFRVLLGTWLDDMHFACSRRLFAESPHALRLIADLPQKGPYAAARACLLRRLETVRRESMSSDGAA